MDPTAGMISFSILLGSVPLPSLGYNHGPAHDGNGTIRLKGSSLSTDQTPARHRTWQEYSQAAHQLEYYGRC
jgi:hypothetical protein